MRYFRLAIVIPFLVIACGQPSDRSDAARAETGDSVDHADSSHAVTGDSAHTALTLRPIMQQLGIEMGRLTAALWLEDYALMTASAGAIADHAHIAEEELARVQRTLGADMEAFETIDREVHESAVTLHDAARARDLDAIVRQLGEVQRGCVACHTRFRDRLRTDR